MDPTLAQALVDTSIPVSPGAPGSSRRPRAARTPRVRQRVATVMRRLADRLDAPDVQPAPCT